MSECHGRNGNFYPTHEYVQTFCVAGVTEEKCTRCGHGRIDYDRDAMIREAVYVHNGGYPQ